MIPVLMTRPLGGSVPINGGYGSGLASPKRSIMITCTPGEVDQLPGYFIRVPVAVAYHRLGPVKGWSERSGRTIQYGGAAAAS